MTRNISSVIIVLLISFFYISNAATAANRHIAMGDNHTFAIQTDETLWDWGDNAYGQLGDGTTTQRNSPEQIDTDNKWVFITAGAENTVAVKSDGTLWAWGDNTYGELGDDTTIEQDCPEQMFSLGVITPKIGVFSAGPWYLDMNVNGAWDGGTTDKVVPNFGVGLPNVIPVTGDWDGTGKTRIGVFTNGTWYLDIKGDGVWDGGVVDKVVPNFGVGLHDALPIFGRW